MTQKAKTMGRKPTAKAKQKRSYTMTEAALAQRTKNIPTTQAKTPEEIDYNARLIDHVLKVQAIAAQTDIKDPVSVRAAFLSFLQLCQEDGFKVSNLAACAAIGISRQTLINWSRSDREEFRQIAELIQSTCALSREQLIADNKLNPVIGIFWQRNFDGLRNDTEQTQSIEQDQTDDIRTASEYREKYGHLLPE